MFLIYTSMVTYITSYKAINTKLIGLGCPAPTRARIKHGIIHINTTPLAPPRTRPRASSAPAYRSDTSSSRSTATLAPSFARPRDAPLSPSRPTRRRRRETHPHRTVRSSVSACRRARASPRSRSHPPPRPSRARSLARVRT